MHGDAKFRTTTGNWFTAARCPTPWTTTFAGMNLPLIQRLRSFRHPVVIHRAQGVHGPLEVCWERGRKVLNSATANQSFGALHRVMQQVLPQAMKGIPALRSVLLLGMGGGSVIRILRRELKLDPMITVIEIDPVVIALAACHFGMAPDPHLHIINADATLHLHVLRERFDLVVVDLFDDSDPATGTTTSGFIHTLYDRVAEHGRVCFNTLAHDEHTNACSDRVERHLQRTFPRVMELRSEGLNRVFVAS
jgi:spermidine synthase